MNTRISKLIAVLGAFLLSAGGAGMAIAQDELIPANEAFPYTVAVEGDELVVDWNVTPGYYLYKGKISFAIEGSDAELSEPLWPRATPHSDEFFGEQPIYDDDFVVVIPYSGEGDAELVIKSQGCSEALGICFPPQTWRSSVSLIASATPAAPALSSPFGAAPLGQDFLAPEEAFQPMIVGLGGNEIEVGFQIEPDYYLYRHSIKAELGNERATAVALDLPAGKPKFDEYFGDTEIYLNSVIATLAIDRPDTTAGRETLTLTYQGCAEGGICYPEQIQSFEITLPAGDASAGVAADADTTGSTEAGAPVSEQAKLAALITTSNIFAVLGTFFGLGLLLAFTPCVLPMVPILSGIIAGDGDNVTPARGFFLALLYVLGMALTYTIAGAVFAKAGQQAQTVFQQPWILATFAGLFVVLSLSMFGLFELQMPSSIQTRIANISGGQKSGTAVGAFVMGALSSLVVTACVAPPLVAALAVIGQTGDVVRGGLALFALSMGMGTPLLLVGASAGRLLPKAGAWMERVKQAFGFIMLGLAIWMLARLLPPGVVLLMWAVLIFMAGVFLGGLTPLPESPRGTQQMGKGFGMLAMLYGAVLFVGALTGGEDPLQPMKGSVLASRGGALQAEAPKLQFAKIKTVSDLENAVASAAREGKAVMLDFYADWCVSCKEMEKYTFTDQTVIAALEDTVLLKADVTANDQDDKDLMAVFGIFGPPSIIFYGPDGVLRPGYQVVGYMAAEKFSAHVDRATSPNRTQTAAN
ncbi:MAG: protein-disulfide reductase DsbD [Pseudomonadota bacterium]